MTPSQFLTVAGPASLFIGILGILSPGFTEEFWFDLPENIGHMAFGIVALLVLSMSLTFQWWFVLMLTIFTAIFAIGGLFVTENPAPNFFITNLEHPIDNALHLTFIVIGFISLLPKRAWA